MKRIYAKSSKIIYKRKSEVQLRSINFLCCVISVHKLLKCVIVVPKLNLGL
jgi:hypothetical protein